MPAARLLALVAALASSALPTLAADADTYTVPAGTAIDVRVDRDLHSDEVVPGESFTATVITAVEVDGHTVIPPQSTLEGRVTTVRSAHASGVIGVHFVQLRRPEGDTYDVDGVLAPTREGESVPVSSAKKSAVVLIGNEADSPGKRASTLVGHGGEDADHLAARWSQSGLSPRDAYVSAGSELRVELRRSLTVTVAVPAAAPSEP